ncbi:MULTISPECIES: hypothetical protein [Streptomycetaceae]|nr:hypothetical protein [Streptomyces sp. CB02056]
MSVITSDTESAEAAESVTLDESATNTIRGNVRAFLDEDNTSMMGGWTN